MVRVASVVAALLITTGCGGGDPVAGETVYTANCAVCHGADGTLGVDSSGVAATDLSVRIAEISDDEITADVQNGIRTMPALTNIDDTQMQDLIAYLRDTFGP